MADGGNLTFIRILRILRLARIMRVFRVVRLVDELRMIVTSIMGSFQSLVWTLCVLFLIIFIIAVFLTQLLVDYRTSNPAVPEVEDLVDKYYSSLFTAILGLYQAVTGGVSWEVLVMPLLNHVSPLVGLVFAFYIAFVVLALMNVVTGVFVESALKTQQEHEETTTMNSVDKIFREIDLDESGKMSWTEFEAQLAMKDVQDHLADVNVRIEDAKALFNMLDWDNSGDVSYSEFLNGVLRLRGVAKSIDVITLLHESRHCWDELSQHVTRVDTQLAKLSKAMGCKSKTSERASSRTVPRASVASDVTCAR
eukprot:gnl/TRDRNA2_/TRDRNA2_161771_c1_seq2.p1 gnl/TRDRNA2_/TRDRNA2_161771_c1~~gnl/TRDRNA2_/TRDRNA2_161771_c1_seq2.p1  ORF type:complete len:309 (+),score=54.66 gnl/TRDRNA2_/TRDRNA2_161771_c1_seq2:1-927(+)